MTTTQASVTRRTVVVGATSLAAAPVLAKAPLLGVARPVRYRFKIGAFEVTTVLDGAVQLPKLHSIFGVNAAEDEIHTLAKANLLPPKRFEMPFSVTLINTGEELILFDCGNGKISGRRPDTGNLLARLGEAGYSADQIDRVVVSHFHPDHIGGIMDGDRPAFPNAEYSMPSAEYDFWSSDDKAGNPLGEMVRANIVPFAERTTFLKGGDTVASGIEAVDASGHTPGHLAFHVESEGARLMLTSDVANHYVVSLQRPDWHVKFDMDKEKAVAARRRIFGMIAADRIPFVGYHMPPPAVGYIEAKGGGFHYIPADYRLNL